MGGNLARALPRSTTHLPFGGRARQVWTLACAGPFRYLVANVMPTQSSLFHTLLVSLDDHQVEVATPVAIRDGARLPVIEGEEIS